MAAATRRYFSGLSIQGLSGSLSDKQQRRKPIALVGYLLAAIGKPLMGVATAWQGVLAARFIDRFGAGARSAPRDALIASSADAQNRGRAFGLEGLGDNAGAFFGPLLAVLLLILFRVPIRVIFYLAAIPGLLAFVIFLFVHELPVNASAKSKLDIGWRRFPPGYWNYLLATALFGIGNSSNAFLILETKDTGASVTLTLVIYAGFNLVAALISYPAGFLSDRFGRRTLLALAIFFVTYLGFALTRNVVFIGVLFTLYGLYQGIFRFVGKALASDYVPEPLHASAVGWYSTTIGLSGLVASLAGGWLWDYVGHSSVFIFGAAFAVVGVIALLALIPANTKRHATPADRCS